jgi:hypothetical protein
MADWKKPAKFQRKERRKYRRIATDQVISFAPVGERDLLGVGRDVSSGGIRFEAIGCEIDLGDVLRVTFNIGHRRSSPRPRGLVDRDGRALQRRGIEFIDIDPDMQQHARRAHERRGVRVAVRPAAKRRLKAG